MTTPPRLLENARALRRRPTDAEAKLWRALRGRQLAGAKFRRQHPIGGYVVDFYCERAKLAIELDGGQHLEPARAAYDAERTRALERAGVRVLRFFDDDALARSEAVLESIRLVLSGSPSP